MDEGGKWQLLGAVAVVALAIFGVVRLLDRSPEGHPAEAVRIERDGTPGEGGVGGGGGSGAGVGSDRSLRRPSGPVVVVHVAGAVARPGVYRIPDGARVAAAVARAGGGTRRADLTAVNLAARLQDGQQVIVPARAGTGGAGSAGAEAPPSLATASADELEELDGIGEAIAERIVEYRESHGGFRSLDELAEVDGIGEKRLEALKEALQP